MNKMKIVTSTSEGTGRVDVKSHNRQYQYKQMSTRNAMQFQSKADVRCCGCRGEKFHSNFWLVTISVAFLDSFFFVKLVDVQFCIVLAVIP